MKRDMELVRKILLGMEEHPHGFAPGDFKLGEYSDEQVGYHVHIMVQAGLLCGHDVTPLGSRSPQVRPTSLTWEGHEFLDAARDATRWAKVMKKVKDVGGAVTIAVLQDLLVQRMKGDLGLP
jgi:hypothetical protein